MKNKTTTMLQTGRTEFTVLDFLILNLFWPRFVSVRGAAFDIRISDLPSWEACFDPRGRFCISGSKILTLAGDNLNLAKERFCAKHALRLIEEAPSRKVRKATLIFRNRHVTRQHETPGRIACFQCDQPLRILSSHFRILKAPMPSHT